jgi:hypothetical protein
MEDQSSTPAPKRTWTGRLLLVVVIVLIAVAVGIVAYQVQKSPCTILINGKPVANVESRFAASRVLAEARALDAHGAPSNALRFTERVTIRSASSSDEISEAPEAVRAVDQAASVEAELFAVSVDGTPMVGLPNKALADRTIEMVKQHYEKGLPNIVGKSTFRGDVFVEKRFIAADRFRGTPEEACNTLTSISEPAITHTVVPGDRAVNVARQYGMSLDTLKGLNPGVEMARLTEGDLLVIQRAKQPVVVLTRSITSKTVDITPPPDAARYGGARTGKRVMRVMMTYENGQPASEEVISQITTWDRPKSSYSEDSSSYSGYSGRHYRHYRRHRTTSSHGSAPSPASPSPIAQPSTP